MLADAYAEAAFLRQMPTVLSFMQMACLIKQNLLQGYTSNRIRGYRARKQKLEAERVDLARANNGRQRHSHRQELYIYILFWGGEHIYIYISIYMVSIVTVAKSWISKPKIRTMGVSDLEHQRAVL